MMIFNNTRNTMTRRVATPHNVYLSAYPLQARWRIRPYYTAFIYLCLSPCSLLFNLSLFVSTVPNNLLNNYYQTNAGFICDERVSTKWPDPILADLFACRSTCREPPIYRMSLTNYITSYVISLRLKLIIIIMYILYMFRRATCSHWLLVIFVK